MSDRYGRKWPLVINLLIVAVLELGSGFVQTFEQFLAVRSLFGIGMGGIWGLAASTSLENLPVEVRGLASGVLQQGYAVGYLLAAVINLTLVPETSASWRALFFTSAGLSAFSAGIRCLLPESAIFIRAKEHARASGFTTKEKTKIFLRETKEMLKKHWMLCIYAVLLMTGESRPDTCTILLTWTPGFNFLSHGSQDLFPTYMQKDKGFSAHDATIATIIGNCVRCIPSVIGPHLTCMISGCHHVSSPSRTGMRQCCSQYFSGGGIAGFVSQYIGRRLTIM